MEFEVCVIKTKTKKTTTCLMANPNMPKNRFSTYYYQAAGELQTWHPQRVDWGELS